MHSISLESLGNRPVVLPVAAFLLGVALGPETETWGWAFLTVSAVFGLYAWCAGVRTGGWLALMLSAISGGAGLAAIRGAADIPPALNVGVKVRIEGEVESVRHAEGTSLGVRVHRVEDQPSDFGAVVFTPESVNVWAGQRVVLGAKLKPTVEASNPGEWNRTIASERRGVVATGTFVADQMVVVSEAPQWRVWLETTRDSLSARLKQLSDDSAATALVATLAAGQRAELDDVIEEDFAKSGLAHILSVSGLHVAILAFAVFGALRWGLLRLRWRLLRRVDPRRIAAPFAIPWVWAYVAFTGFQPPAVRSAVMCSMLLSAISLGRASDALTALAVAAGVMTAVDPATPFDLSVQLSFVAVLSLILLSPVLRTAVPLSPTPGNVEGWRRWWVKGREAALQTALASLAVSLASAPLVLGAFQRVGVAGLASNVVAMPLSGALTIVSAGGAALYVAWAPAATPFLVVAIWLSKVLLACAHWFAELPGSTISLATPLVWVCALWWFGLTMLAMGKGRARWLALTSVAAAALHVTGVGQAPRADLEVTFLAVGQGDSTLVSSQGHHLLIDGGGVPNGTDVGKRVVLPYLKQRGITSLDVAVLSHAHPDHSLGLASTLREVSTAQLWLPAGVDEGPLVTEILDAADDAHVEWLEVGHRSYRLGAASIDVLGPPVDRVLLKGENDRSVVLRVRHGDVTFLLTGDVEEAAEEQLDPGRVTVMKAPHHGSGTSSTPELLAKTRPKFVVFCVGRHNRFGFPNAEVVEAYERLGSECLRTDVDGAITFRSDGHDVTVSTFLDRHQVHARRWHPPPRH